MSGSDLFPASVTSYRRTDDKFLGINKHYENPKGNRETFNSNADGNVVVDRQFKIRLIGKRFSNFTVYLIKQCYNFDFFSWYLETSST